MWTGIIESFLVLLYNYCPLISLTIDLQSIDVTSNLFTQVVAKRLLHYVAAGLLSIEDLKMHIDALESQDPNNVYTNLLHTINDPFELVAELQNLYQESYKSYVHMLKEVRQQEIEDDIGSSVAERLITAFNNLDEDMSTEALSTPSQEGK